MFLAIDGGDRFGSVSNASLFLHDVNATGNSAGQVKFNACELGF